MFYNIISRQQSGRKLKEGAENERLKIERNKLDRIIKLFKNEELIEQQTNKHKTLITLAQWDFYQDKNDYQNDDVMTIK